MFIITTIYLLLISLEFPTFTCNIIIIKSYFLLYLSTGGRTILEKIFFELKSNQKSVLEPTLT